MVILPVEWGVQRPKVCPEGFLCNTVNSSPLAPAGASAVVRELTVVCRLLAMRQDRAPPPEYESLEHQAPTTRRVHTRDGGRLGRGRAIKRSSSCGPTTPTTPTSSSCFLAHRHAPGVPSVPRRRPGVTVHDAARRRDQSTILPDRRNPRTPAHPLGRGGAQRSRPRLRVRVRAVCDVAPTLINPGRAEDHRTCRQRGRQVPRQPDHEMAAVARVRLPYVPPRDLSARGQLTPVASTGTGRRATPPPRTSSCTQASLPTDREPTADSPNRPTSPTRSTSTASQRRPEGPALCRTPGERAQITLRQPVEVQTSDDADANPDARCTNNLFSIPDFSAFPSSAFQTAARPKRGSRSSPSTTRSTPRSTALTTRSQATCHSSITPRSTRYSGCTTPTSTAFTATCRAVRVTPQPTMGVFGRRVQEGDIDDINTPLWPGSYFTSRDMSASSIWDFGYAYPEVPSSYRDRPASELLTFVVGRINALYSPGAVNSRLKPRRRRHHRGRPAHGRARVRGRRRYLRSNIDWVMREVRPPSIPPLAPYSTT